MKPNKETYRILVIDDHPIVAEGIIALASQLEGVTCKGATCAKDVEQLTLKERFDLCIIDLELPDMNGFQLISHLHSQIPCKLQTTVRMQTSNKQQQTTMTA